MPGRGLELAGVDYDDVAGPLQEVEQGQPRCPRIDDADRGGSGFLSQGPGQVNAHAVVASEHAAQPDDYHVVGA